MRRVEGIGACIEEEQREGSEGFEEGFRRVQRGQERQAGHGWRVDQARVATGRDVLASQGEVVDDVVAAASRSDEKEALGERYQRGRSGVGGSSQEDCKEEGGSAL